MTRVLIAGATGYLGKYVTEEFKNQDYYTKVIIRNREKFDQSTTKADEIITAELTNPSSLHGCCENIDIVFSSVGITKQKDGLTYMDVDYQANLNLLKEAQSSGVRKFMYVSVFHGDELRNLKICEAKEAFVDALKISGLDYCIIRPTGYFSDMEEFYKMAEKGNIYLFGNGNHKMNPIHGQDLAKVCVHASRGSEKEVLAGGPAVLSHNQIAATAFSAIGKKKKITHIPGWIQRTVLFLLRTFTNSKTYGPIEFLMAVLSTDLVAPAYGNHTLKSYFEELKSGSSKS